MMPQRRYTTALLRLLLLLLLALNRLGTLSSYAESPASAPLTFVAMGDMPYHADDVPKLRALLQRIDAAQPAFVVHVGDIKNGLARCSVPAYQQFIDTMNTLQHTPWILTPGDNEWTDCDRPPAGGFDPVERLTVLRSMVYTPQWFASLPFPVVSQGVRDKTPCVENLRWVLQSQSQPVVFTTLHVVGSNNNRNPQSSKALAEFTARDATNQAWLHEAFETAKTLGAQQVVLMMQADPSFGLLTSPAPSAHRAQQRSGFLGWYNALVSELQTFDGQVLLIHGDSHNFRVDMPLAEHLPDPVARKLTRVITFGERQVHGVAVAIEPHQPQDPFQVAAFW